jgi:UDP-N-acetylmuramate-alanine ligase
MKDKKAHSKHIFFIGVGGIGMSAIAWQNIT